MRAGAAVFVAVVVAGCGGGGVERATTQGRAAAPMRVAGLPAEGLAMQTPRAIEFRTLDGRLVSRLPRARLADRSRVPLEAVPFTVRRRAYVLDTATGAVRPHRVRVERTTGVPKRCPAHSVVASGYVACDDELLELAPEGARRIAGTPPPPSPHGIGHWAYVLPSPDGSTLLAQWFSECEIPTAFFVGAEGGLRTVTGERDRRDAPNSTALGWTRDGRAVVSIPEAPGCGSGIRAPGVYLVDPVTGARELALETTRPVTFWRTR